jgi:hypothetical protein
LTDLIDKFRAMRGFNYVGSWSTNALETWNNFDTGQFEFEVRKGKELFPSWNLARWWLSFEAFTRDPGRFLSHFEAGLTTFDSLGIEVMPVIFNRWHDPNLEYGDVMLEHLVPGLSIHGATADSFGEPGHAGARRFSAQDVFGRYVVALVEAHKADTRIVAWDLCNEPLCGPYIRELENPALQAELRWLRWVSRTVRTVGATQPLTIGHIGYVGASYVEPNWAFRLTEDMVDVHSFHPYSVPGSHDSPEGAALLEKDIDAAIDHAASTGKPLFASETVWGANDDAAHVDRIRDSLDPLSARAIGFAASYLVFSYGPVNSPGKMHFMNPDGTIRPGHEIFNRY